MPAPSPAPELDHLNGRAFSFYPPILNIDHNEWNLKEVAWSEILVHNTQDDREIWVPRRFVGEVSSIEKPVMIVGLNKELEYNAGILRPHERRVLNMPKADNAPAPLDAKEVPTPKMVGGVRLGGGGESKMGLIIGGSLVIALLLVFGGINLLKDDRVEYSTVMQEDLGFSASDDYWAIVRNLGSPAQDRWRPPSSAGLEFRALTYPDRHLTVILMGTDRKDAHYIGALNDQWKPVHTLKQSGNGNTRSLLAKLPPF